MESDQKIKGSKSSEEELFRSRIRLRYNMEKIYSKYEKIEESGVEIDLLTSELYTRDNADKAMARKRRELFYSISENFGLASVSAPNNCNDLLDENKSLMKKCEKYDKEFNGILEMHKQKIIDEYLEEVSYLTENPNKKSM